MTNYELLEDRIRRSGKKKEYLAKKCGMSRQSFRNCCQNISEFRTGQVQILCEELGITTLEDRQAIFFAQDVA
jgi:hypothetical protein